MPKAALAHKIPATANAPADTSGTWLDQVTRNPNLDEAISSFVGSINFLRRVGLADEEIRRLCQINLMYVRRGP